MPLVGRENTPSLTGSPCLPSYVQRWLSARGLDVSLGCARVIHVEDQDEEKYHWVVWFRKGGKLYTYMYRSVPDMVKMVQDHYAKHAVHPYRMWVLVEGEIQKVEIKKVEPR